MAPLDRMAEETIMRTSRNVAAATALIPLALVDVLAALTGNLRMVREIAEIYGGRAGWLGSWRLMRTVAAHLIATGAVAVADDLLGPLIGAAAAGLIAGDPRRMIWKARAGTPAAVQLFGISPFTSAECPMMLPSPTSAPPSTVALLPLAHQRGRMGPSRRRCSSSS